MVSFSLCVLLRLWVRSMRVPFPFGLILLVLLLLLGGFIEFGLVIVVVRLESVRRIWSDRRQEVDRLAGLVTVLVSVRVPVVSWVLWCVWKKVWSRSVVLLVRMLGAILNLRPSCGLRSMLQRAFRVLFPGLVVLKM